MIKVSVYSTLGQSEKQVTFSGSTWRELTEELGRNGIQYKGMSAVNGDTQVSYESGDAILPDQDFDLFLMPKEVKSGCDDDNDDLDETTEDQLLDNLKEIGEIIEESIQLLQQKKNSKKGTKSDVKEKMDKAAEIMRNMRVFD